MSDSFAYLSEIDGMKKIEAFLNDPASANLTDFEIISANKRKERAQKAKRASDYIRFALEQADIYVAGEKVSTKAKDVTARISEAFEKLINSEYHKLKCMETQPDQSDIMDVLKRPKAQVSISDLGHGNEKDYEALNSVMEEIRYAGKNAVQYSVKQALDQFMDPPYGYTGDDIEYLIAVLYRRGHISLKMNSVIYTPAGTAPEDAYKYITKREFREKVLLEIKEAAPQQHIRAVKDVIKEFFGKTVTSDDQDTLMRDYRSYAQTKRLAIENVLRDNYGMNSRLPGRKILEKSLRLIDDSVKINDPISFYKRVNELCDDFIETGLDMGDLNSFLEGVQKEKFLHGVKALNIYEKSKNYISDQTIIDDAAQLKKILSVEKPYAFIPKLEEYDKKLMGAIMELLDHDTKRIEPDIYADWKMVKTSIPADRPYSQRLLDRIDPKFEELLDKLKSVTDIAALNGIPSESNALLQNCLRMIQREEDAYQAEMERRRKEKERQGGGKEVKPTPQAEPVKVIRNKPVSFRSITGNKTYSIKSEEDIDKMLDELRNALKAQLEDDTIIKLS